MILGGFTFNQWPRGDLNWARGVSAGASCCLRYITRLRKASLGYNRGFPVAPWPIFSPHTPFFWVVKVRITKVAAARSSLVAVSVSNTVRPTLKVKSDSRNGELSDLVPVYYPGRSRKKKAMMIISAIACSSGSLEAAAMQASRQRTWTSIGYTRDDRGLAGSSSGTVAAGARPGCLWASSLGLSPPASRSPVQLTVRHPQPFWSIRHSYRA